MELNSSTMQLKLLEAAADMHAFHAPFGVASKTLRKVSKALEDYVVNPGSLKEKGILVLIAQASVNKQEREDHMTWAGKLNVSIAGTGIAKKCKTKA